MREDLDTFILGLTIGGGLAVGSGVALLAWYALGVFATWLDTREDDAPHTDPEEPR